MLTKQLLSYNRLLLLPALHRVLTVSADWSSILQCSGAVLSACTLQWPVAEGLSLVHTLLMTLLPLLLMIVVMTCFTYVARGVLGPRCHKAGEFLAFQQCQLLQSSTSLKLSTALYNAALYIMGLWCSVSIAAVFTMFYIA
jgi:hypothetical protein